MKEHKEQRTWDRMGDGGAPVLSTVTQRTHRTLLDPPLLSSVLFSSSNLSSKP